MSDAKKYHVGDSGLVEGEALGRITVYLAADYDRLIDVYLAAGDRAQALATRIHHLEQSERQAQQTATLALSTGARVALERDALQQRLTVQDQRVDELETELKVTKQALNSLKGERDDLSAGRVQCQFPQSCTTRCDCDIPDFSPGSGNRARRRASAFEALKPENQRVVPVDPFTICHYCFGSGTICTGILEASSTVCNRCDGTGREQP